MVSLTQRLRHWLADEPLVYECRNCGTTLDAHQETCSTCGADEIVCYNFE